MRVGGRRDCDLPRVVRFSGKATIPQSALSHSQPFGPGPLCRCATSPHTVGSHPLHKGAFNSTPIESFWPRRGQCGKREKSVKKNAALLHFLGFFSLTLLFGVLRGEQPLRRGPLPRNSGTLFVSFLGHKKGKPCGGRLRKKALPQGRQGRGGTKISAKPIDISRPRC